MLHGVNVGNPDYVLDCIDNIDTKVDLLHACVKRQLRVISSMGAGAKGDPSQIQVADIDDTQGACQKRGGRPLDCHVDGPTPAIHAWIHAADPLSRSVRRRLKRLGVDSGIPVVYSTEKSSIKLLPLDEEQLQDVESYKTLPNFRIRILPVLGAISPCVIRALLTRLADRVSPFDLIAVDSIHPT